MKTCSHSRCMTLIRPNTALADSVISPSMAAASADSLLLRVTASSRPSGEVSIIIFTAGWQAGYSGASFTVTVECRLLLLAQIMPVNSELLKRQ